MSDRGWNPADLMRASGISKQVLSGILNDTREKLDRLPTDKTVDGFARAFSIPRDRVLLAVGQAMGLPVGESVVVYDAAGASDDDILRVLGERLRAREVGGERDRSSASRTDAGATPALEQDDVELAADRITAVDGLTGKQRFTRRQDADAEAPDPAPEGDDPA